MKKNPLFQSIRFAIKGVLVIAGLVLYLASCNSSNKGSSNPLGPAGPPSAQVAKISLSPSVASVDKNATLKFSAIGGTGAYTWTLNNATLASIVANDGTFTAGNASGTVVVTATDSLGAKGNANIFISTKGLTVTPASAQVLGIQGSGGTQTFTSTGTSPFFWTLSNSAIGSIGTTTGIFTATTVTGTGTISVVDSAGNIGAATITVVSTTAMALSPAAQTVSTLPTGTLDYTTTGAVGTVTFALSGATNSYSGTAINASTGAVTVTTMPNALQGNQTLKITATDSVSRTAIATLTLTAPAALAISPTTLTVSSLPSSALTYTTTGAVGTVTFTLTGATNSYSGATINASTGSVTVTAMPTVAQTAQTLTVRATDGLGQTSSSTLTLSVPALSLSPSTTTVTTLPTSTIAYTASNASGTTTFALSGATGSYTGATISSTTGAVTVTAMPTTTQGAQTLTITVTDGASRTATATLILNAV
jgi:hypothetical protein